MRNIQKYYSIKINANIKRKTKIRELNNNMSIFISDAMNKNEFLQNLHNREGYKHYSFSTPYLKNGEGICNFEIRSFNKNIVFSFMSALTGYDNDWIEISSIELNENVFYSRIKAIETITPSVLVVHPKILENYNIKSNYANVHWTCKMPMGILEESITNNLQNKYNSLTDSNIEFDDIIKDIKLLNDVPIGIDYSNKRATLLGNKMKVEFEQGKQAQMLARVAVVEGLLEKNAILGLGFVKPIYEQVVI